MRISFDTTVRLSDFLTSLSFILAVIALVYSQKKDRNESQKQRLAEARMIMSTALSKFERFSELSDSFFDIIQPHIVESTEIWAAKKDVIVARDYLWKQLNIASANIDRQIMEEAISTSYVELYRINKEMPETYLKVLGLLKEAALTARDATLLSLQEVIMSYERNDKPVTAIMGNTLRNAVNLERKKFRDDISRISSALRIMILNNLEKGDNDLLETLQLRK